MSAADYYNQVVYIESMRYRAHWLDAHHSGNAYFTESPQQDVIDKVWAKWTVKKGPGSAIVLESVRYRNKYLDAHHSGNCHVTYSAYPNDAVWALWYLEDDGNDTVCLRSKRYDDNRLDAHHSGKACVTKGSGYWSALKIYQPTVDERKELLFSYDNTKGTTAVQTEYTEKTGISKTTSTSQSATVTSEIGEEIKSIFSAKTSFSSTWSKSTSSTWSNEIIKTVKVEVKPGTKKEIYQLTGYYGEDANKYTVSSNHLFFEG